MQIHRGESDPEILACNKIHSRWISTAKFSSFSNDNNLGMITASDDGTIKLWDLTKKNLRSSQPKLIFSANSIHSRGVFALDESFRKVLSGSKDKSVCVSEVLDDGCIHRLTTFEHHSKVVKSVSWKNYHIPDQNVFLSGSEDNRVVLKDIRSSNNSDVSIIESFKAGVHTVTWNNTQGTYF